MEIFTQEDFSSTEIEKCIKEVNAQCNEIQKKINEICESLRAARCKSFYLKQAGIALRQEYKKMTEKDYKEKF